MGNKNIKQEYDKLSVKELVITLTAVFIAVVITVYGLKLLITHDSGLVEEDREPIEQVEQVDSEGE